MDQNNLVIFITSTCTWQSSSWDNFYFMLYMISVVLLKSEAFLYHRPVIPYVRPYPAVLVDLDMLEFSYRIQTLHYDSYNIQAKFRKNSNCLIVYRKSIRPFKTGWFIWYNYLIHLIFRILHPRTIRYI